MGIADCTGTTRTIQCWDGREIIIAIKNVEGMGYTNQKYAIEIKALKILPTPKPLSDFISWAKVKKHLKSFNSLVSQSDRVELHAFLFGFRNDIPKSFRVDKAPRKPMLVLDVE